MRKCRLTADSPEALAKALENQAHKINNDDTLFWHYDEQSGKWVAEYEED